MAEVCASEKKSTAKVQGGPCPLTTTLPPSPSQSRRQLGDLRASCSCARGWGSGTIWGGSFNNSSVSSSSSFVQPFQRKIRVEMGSSLPPRRLSHLLALVWHWPRQALRGVGPSPAFFFNAQATFVLKPTHHAKHSRTPPLSTHTAPSAARGPTRSTPRPIAPDERRVRASWSAQRPTR